MRRSRRNVGDQQKLVVTYGINIGDTIVDVEEWEPSSFLDVGQEVDVDVRVRTFQSRSGRPCSQLERFLGAKGAF